MSSARKEYYSFSCERPPDIAGGTGTPQAGHLKKILFAPWMTAAVQLSGRVPLAGLLENPMGFFIGSALELIQPYGLGHGLMKIV